jgi:hypothetical protein
MISELVRATVAEPKPDTARYSGERRARQTCDHRNTNVQRGRLRAARVLGNSKPNPHNDAASRGRWNARKVQALTRGGLRFERGAEVSRGRSSDLRERGQTVRLTNDTAQPEIMKDRSIGTMAYPKALRSRRKDPSTREAARKAKIPDDHSGPKGKPVQAVMWRRSSQELKSQGGGQS